MLYYAYDIDLSDYIQDIFYNQQRDLRYANNIPDSEAEFSAVSTTEFDKLGAYVPIIEVDNNGTCRVMDAFYDLDSDIAISKDAMHRLICTIKMPYTVKWSQIIGRHIEWYGEFSKYETDAEYYSKDFDYDLDVDDILCAVKHATERPGFLAELQARSMLVPPVRIINVLAPQEKAQAR